jgi:hypothetical protein
MKRYRRFLSRLFIESILIVVSVLVALGVNDWKTRRDAAAHAAEARQAFISDLAATRAMLQSDAILPYHQKLQAIYARAAAASAPDPQDLFQSGLHPATFNDAAWRSFSTPTIFADFRVNDVLILSKIYHAQTEIERRTESFLLALTSPRSDRETPAYQRDSALSIWLFLNDLVPAEQRLIKQYDDALEQLRSAR